MKKLRCLAFTIRKDSKQFVSGWFEREEVWYTTDCLARQCDSDIDNVYSRILVPGFPGRHLSEASPKFTSQ